MWCRVPGRGEFSSKGLQHTVTGGSDWAGCETPCFLKAGERPDLIRLNVVCAGTVLIRGIELLHTPLKQGAGLAPRSSSTWPRAGNSAGS